MAVTLISKAAYARHRGCDEKAVRKAIAENRISCFDGKIDAAVADIQWANNTRARADSKRPAPVNSSGEWAGSQNAAQSAVGPNSRPAATAPGSEPGYADYRIVRERADAERAQMETAKMAGRLIDRDSTERAIFDAFRALRDRVMACSQRAAPKLIGLADARDIEMAIADELRKAFAGWEVQMLDRLPVREGAP